MPFNHNYKTPKVIAEIGCNHMGKIEIAKELIELAKSCNADVAKFQARDNKLLLTEVKYSMPIFSQHCFNSLCCASLNSKYSLCSP